MPLPWKKAKVTRISRLVADLHHSPKRGGSLVVHTGFPTSLIDLFVKSQDRLRKSARRKPSPDVPPPRYTHSPPNSFPSSPPSSCAVQQLPSREPVLIERAECEHRIAFHPAFKVFLVVALAVRSPNLALWIMTLAFLLVLLEFVGSRYFGFLRPQPLILCLGSWLQRALFVLKKRWDWDCDCEQGSQQELAARQQQQRQGIVFSDSCQGDDCVEEIQIAEYMDEGCERIVDILEKSSEILIHKSEHRCGRDRIKAALIEKFVPKKFRKGKKLRKKKNKSQEEEEESCNGPSDVDISLDGLNKIDDDGADHESGEQVAVEIEVEEEEEEESCEQVVEGEGGEKISTSSVQVLEKGKSGSEHLILILLGTVLAGLLGGRGLSLVLTLVCCLVVRC